MDGSSFDRLSRRFAATTNRREGVAALLAGTLGVIGVSSASAVVPVPPVCRSTGMECSDSIPCCSGRCILKRDGTSRCARKSSNRKRHGNSGKGDHSGKPNVCTSLLESCGDSADCCGMLECDYVRLLCCEPTNGSCKANEDCCTDLVCDTLTFTCQLP